MNPSVKDKVHKFFTTFPLRSFDKKAVIVQSGSEPPGVLYLIEGKVMQYDISPTGNIIAVNVFKPPAFFPMSWAINRTANDYSFEALTVTKVHVAPSDKVVAFLKNNPDVLFDLLARVYRGTDGVLRRMAHLMGGSARTRLIFELINAGTRFGAVTTGTEITIGLNQTDLARNTGLARESVSREVQRLKTEGLIGITGQSITIKDLSALEDLLGDGL